MKTSLLILLVSIIYISSSFAQDSYIGVDFGYGNSSLTIMKNRTIISPFKENSTQFVKVGFKCGYTPTNTKISIRSGVNFETRNYDFFNQSFIKIPIGIDLILGKRIQCIAGLGTYLAYLLKNGAGQLDINMIPETNTFYYGAQFNLGIGYSISNNIIINLEYITNFDYSKMYIDEGPVYGIGPHYTSNVFGIDGYIDLTLKYRLKK